MDEKVFDTLASHALERLETALSDVADDLDVDLSNGILMLEFADGVRYVINSHAAARQIWMAANLSAAHFSYDEPSQTWLDTRSGRELFAEIGRIVSEKLARSIHVTA